MLQSDGPLTTVRHLIAMSIEKKKKAHALQHGQPGRLASVEPSPPYALITRRKR